MQKAELLKIAKPILFNTDMTVAILEDRKTVTRRVVKFPKYIKSQENGLYTLYAEDMCYENQHLEDIAMYLNKPYQPGDILYVRETWRCWRAHRYEANADIMYKAGGEGVRLEFPYGNTDSINRDDYDRFVHKWYSEKWHPSIHMPKEAARIFLKVKDVREERLQDITEEQALKEGIHYDECPAGYTWKQRTSMVDCYTSAVGAFGHLWNTIIKSEDRERYSWESLPWVWVIEFERIEPDAKV